MMKKFALMLSAALGTTSAAYADRMAELNQFFEDNAVSAAYARMCDEEPVAEELKANTMMLLAVSGIEPRNIQLGSAKWGQILRREYATANAKNVNCPERVSEAKARLSETQHIIQATRKP